MALIEPQVEANDVKRFGHKEGICHGDAEMAKGSAKPHRELNLTLGNAS